MGRLSAVAAAVLGALGLLGALSIALADERGEPLSYERGEFDYGNPTPGGNPGRL